MVTLSALVVVMLALLVIAVPLTAAPTLADELQLATTAGVGQPVTVMVDLSFPELGWDTQEDLCLLGLASSPEQPPDVVALTWGSDEGSWFPTWVLSLESTARLLAPHEPADGATRIELTDFIPEEKRLYRAALSYDPTSGDLSVGLWDITSGKRVFAKHHLVQPYAKELIPTIGVAADHRHEVPSVDDEQGLRFLQFQVAPSYVPLAAQGGLFVQENADWSPLVTTRVSKSQALAVQLHVPPGTMSGHLQLTAVPTDSKTVDQVVIAVLPKSPGKHFLALPTDLLPLGHVTLRLEYVNGADVWLLTEKQVSVVHGELHATVIPDTVMGERFTGRLKLKANTDLHEVKVKLLCHSARAEISQWGESGLEETILESAIPHIGTEELVVPFEMTMTDDSSALQRLRLRVDVEPRTIAVDSAGGEVSFVPYDGSTKKPARDYKFDGSMSREVLENYLSRAMTVLGLADAGNQQLLDDVRMIINTGARFVGRAAYAWQTPGDDEAHFVAAERAAGVVHEADPEIILQAAVFEAVYEDVERIPIPEWVFLEFGLQPEDRSFRYRDMLFADGRFLNQWGEKPSGSVPDMSRLETRMWFYYRARRYIDAGYEALHLGQVHLMDQNDPGHVYWQDILNRIRAYAAQNARRHFLLCDAHTHGVVEDGHLLFDFHSFPLRIAEAPGEPQKGRLEVGRIDSIYHRSKGGVTPSGWTTTSLPYIVEFDNWGSSGRGGQSVNDWWTWGYDEICWFARQTEDYRNAWLHYAWDWVREHDPNGWLQMPGKRCLADPVNGVYTYSANTRSIASPHGFNQEETIKTIWDEAM